MVQNVYNSLQNDIKKHKIELNTIYQYITAKHITTHHKIT